MLFVVKGTSVSLGFNNPYTVFLPLIIQPNRSPQEVADLTLYDLTHTSLGNQLIAETVMEWEQQGFTVSPEELGVYNVGDEKHPDLTVIRSNVKWYVEETNERSVEVCDADNHCYASQPRFIVAELIPDNFSGQPRAVNGEWSLYSNQCFARKYYYTSSGVIWGRKDVCYKINRLNNDGNTTRDFWQMEMWATGKSIPTNDGIIWLMKSMFVEGRPSSAHATQSWVDWYPRSDLNLGGCQNIEIGVSVSGASIVAGHQACETWDITKYTTAGQFKNEWKHWLGLYNTDREVAFMVASSVAQGRIPAWVFVY